MNDKSEYQNKNAIGMTCWRSEQSTSEETRDASREFRILAWIGSHCRPVGNRFAAQQAPKSGTAPCFGFSCPIQPVAQPPAKSETGAPDKPYDWKASFAAYKVGKVPRTADGKPDLQGIWSRSILTPLERPGNESDKTEYDPSVRAELEDAAQQRQFDLRTEPTDTPPGEKTTDAYNTFWRDGYWYKVPMTSLHTSQVVDPPDGRLPPLTPAAREQRDRADYLLNRPATGPEDRPLSSRCVRPSASVRRLPVQVPEGKNPPCRLFRAPGGDRSCGSPSIADDLPGRTSTSPRERSSGDGCRARALGWRYTRR